MFIPSKNKLIPLSEVKTAFIDDVGRGATIIQMKDGTKHDVDLDLESIESMACPTIQAHPGYLKLFYSFTKDEEFEHPIIAWRIRAPYGIEPISFLDNDLPWPGLEAVRYPDGRIIVNDGTGAKTLRSKNEWIAHAKKIKTELGKFEEEK